MLKFATRLLLMGCVLVIFFLGISRVLALGGDGEIHYLARWYLAEMRRSDALHQRRLEQAEAMRIKKVVTEEFIAGSLTLREAADQFSEADAIVQEDADGLVASYIAPKTPQELCSQVEVWTEMTLCDGYSSEEVEEVRCRLLEEMSDLFPAETLID